MPQIEFDGQGTPNPTIALPPFGGDQNIPPTMLTFSENAEFSATQYRDLGFTHFEAWCVGAAGGRGGDTTSVVISAEERIQRPVPQDVWNLRLELIRIQDYVTRGNVWDYVYAYGGGLMMTAAQAEEYFNPNHLLQFVTIKEVVLLPQIEAMGGAGGGGGFQKTSGLLADLPDSVPIVVGKAGVDAPLGQTKQYGIWTPDFARTYLDTNVPWPGSRLNELYNFFTDYLFSYPPPHNSFAMPMAGSDGGYSAFDDLCMASGGKGGAAGKVWDGSQFIVAGQGGAGGIGGQIVSGGGGAGSTVEGINGSDGVWHPEIGIGGGGGGGKGGLPSTYTDGGPIGGGFGAPRIEITHFATAGGQGSYSFGDTSVYGQRQFRQSWTYLKPVASLTTGILTYVSTTELGALVIPGGGGGARPTKNLKVGSNALGYSPNGIVVLRLTRIVDEPIGGGDPS